MKSILLRILSLVALFGLPISLTGCVAVWGKGYEVISSNSEGMMIQYDPVVATPSEVAGVAQEEASKYGRVIVPGDHEQAHYPGIQQRYFKFVKPTAQGRQVY